jgi:glycerophosphoryl diester phosphodiesterase
MWQRRDANRPHGVGSGGARPLVIAHRGASVLEPENSLAAFSRAAKDGADGVELDVLCCASGEVIVFHDDDLARLAGRPERVADLSLAQLRAVTLTSGARIPTLEEALEACGPALLVNIELKTVGYGGGPIGPLVERVAAIVERTGTAERVLVSSFHPRAVWSWMRRSPQVPAGLLFEAQAALPLRAAWAQYLLRPRALHPEAALCAPATVARWHRAGYLVNVWTVDDAPTLQALSRMGVDAVITNDPARTRQILAQAA